MNFICPECGKEIEPIEKEIVTTIITKETDGQVKCWIEEVRDLDRILLSKRVDNYTYHQSGEVNTITLSIYDGENNKLSEKEILHDVNGRSIVVNIMKKTKN